MRSIPTAVRSISDRSAVVSPRSAGAFYPAVRSANTAQGDRSAVEFPCTATSPSCRDPPSCFEPPSYATGTRYPRENDDFFPTIPFYSDEDWGGEGVIAEKLLSGFLRCKLSFRISYGFTFYGMKGGTAGWSHTPTGTNQ